MDESGETVRRRATMGGIREIRWGGGWWGHEKDWVEHNNINAVGENGKVWQLLHFKPETCQDTAGKERGEGVKKNYQDNERTKSWLSFKFETCVFVLSKKL